MPALISDSILELLRERPRAAVELYDALAESGHSRGLARTTVARLVERKAIRASRLRLGKGGTILFARGDAGPNHELVRRLYEKEFFGRPALVALVQCLRSTHPTVTRVELAKLAVLEIGTPDAVDWDEVDTLADGLVELGLLQPIAGPVSQPLWAANAEILRKAGIGFSPEFTAASFRRLREKFRLTTAEAVAKWMRLNGLSAFNGTKSATVDEPFVNYIGLPFDILGFCHAAGVAKRRGTESTPKPFLGDVLDTRCTVAYARSFIARVRQVSAKQKLTPLSFVFAKVFETAAFEELKQAGVFAWTHDQLLGSKAAEALQDIIKSIEKFLRHQDLDPEFFAQALDGIENFESLFGNLKGKLFELMIGYVFQRGGYDCKLGWEVNDATRTFDVDVIGLKENEAVIIECKGLRSDKVVPNSEVLRHFTQRTPLARASVDGGPQNTKRFKSIVVTSGKFDDSTVAALSSDELRARSDTAFELWDRIKLIEQLRERGYPQLVSVVDQYYGKPA